MRLIIKICLLSTCFVHTLLLNAQNDSSFNREQLVTFPLESPRESFLQLKVPYNAFIFLSHECPLCQNLMPTLNQLHEKYGKTVQFLGVIPGNAYSMEMISRFTTEYKVSFPLYIDSSMQLSNYLQASVTPQVILLNDECQLIYKGAIDNLMMELGKKRVTVTQHYFQDALEAIQTKGIVSRKRTKAIGCKINDY